MKFSLFSNHGALNSKPVFEAFAQGIKNLGHDVVLHDLNADYYVIWSVLWQGRMRGNQEIWNLAKKLKKPVIILEVGSLIRGVTWKIGLNHINAHGYDFDNFEIDFQRSKKLGLSLKPWRKNGEKIVIFGQHTKSELWSNRPPLEVWLKNTIVEIKKHTSRPIFFRPHPRDRIFNKTDDFFISNPIKIPNSHDVYDHESELSNTWCSVNVCSGTGMQSIIEGVPVFCEKDSLAWPVSIQKIENIGNPTLPDREVWFEHICHTEWTLDEIATGKPILNFVAKS